jgi:hypothetical protein
LFALVPVLLTTLALAGESAPADHVALTFGWRPGMKATVTMAEVRDNGAGPHPTSSLVGSLEVRDLGQGELELRVSHAKQAKGSSDPTVAAFLSEFRGVMPSERVDASGVWQGLVDPDAARRSLAKVAATMNARLTAEAGEDPQALAALDLQRTAVEHALALEVVAGRSQKVWNDEVGFWLGADLEVGRVYEFDSEQATPQGGTLKSHITFQVLERAPCSDAKGAPQCVRLTLKTQADPDAVRAMTLAVMQPALQAMGMPPEALVEARDESTLTLLVEPDTLRPWHSVGEQHTTVTVDAHEPSGPQTTTRVTTRTKTWAWK